ncbi:DUF3592 domain-containing protein [Mucilaginibacter conchicola]|uniref:DUF3592 domain-containing protein n=1 Tax=Mucilaginibacter conchicola TaxID=2303333 RepID=A0A372NWK0_9SPHI|nr:DUF3592 domain-containing protein [Mucilaginibacter conchicola]RFZ94069.1 DUF3592 domain-containing protein [Mucilaginibacter conchicola]
MHINLSDDNFNQLIILMAGLIFLLAGYFNLKRKRFLYDKGIGAEGVVISIERNDGFRFGKNADINWFVTIRYLTNDKLWITKRYDELNETLPFTEGDKVKIIYDPADPEEFILDNSSSKYGPLVFTTIGILMIAGSVLFYFFNIKTGDLE